MLRGVALGAAVGSLVACVGGASSAPDGGVPDAMAPDAPPIPMGTIPCEAPEYWPLDRHLDPVVVRLDPAGAGAL